MNIFLIVVVKIFVLITWSYSPPPAPNQYGDCWAKTS